MSPFFRIGIALTCLSLTGCAFFNTFFNARKSYNNGVASLKKAREQTQTSSTSKAISLDRFSLEGVTPTEEAKRFFDLAIEKGNKVVVLHPKSGWVENAILLMGKAHYLRGTGNDYYDAKNRFEVFMTRYASSRMLPEARLWYGKTLIKLRLEGDAREALRQIPFLTTDPDLIAESLLFLGDLSSAGASPDVALDYYRQASDQKSRAEIRRVALFKSAFVLYSFGRFEEAVVYFQRLNKEELEIPERFDVILLSARCFKALGQHTKAIAVLDKVVGDLRYKNHFAQAEFEIADALRLQGKHREAEIQFNHVVDTYKNPMVSGDAFYMLGTMHDTTLAYDSSMWTPQYELAVKYYSIVQSKYSQSPYNRTAAARLDHLRKLEKEYAAIRSTEFLLHHVRLRLEDSMTVAAPEDSLADSDSTPALDFSAIELIRRDGYLKAFLDDSTAQVPVQEIADQRIGEETDEPGIEDRGLKKQITPKEDTAPSIAELQNIRIDHADVKQIVSDLKIELEVLYTHTPTDSLRVREAGYYSRLASHYMSIADYYDQTLARYDSALYYYTKVGTGFPGSGSEELAYYSVARIHFKQKSSFYRQSFETALEKFPNGQLVSVARRVLGIGEPARDTLGQKMEEVENLMFRGLDFDRALRLLEEVAGADSGLLRTRALYVMGWLFERKLGEPEKAFRAYTTVTLLSPGSDFAQRILPKVEAYARRRGISQDSLKFWSDVRYFKPVVVEKKEPVEPMGGKSSDTTKAAGDSLGFFPLDSLKVGSILDSLSMEIDSTFLKRLKNDSTLFQEDAIKEEEEDAEKPE